MDPGEQTTGTRDEHYNLISVLYHALHGAENCNTYALDAEAAGRDDIATFFREAQVVQKQLAERAKLRLGIGDAASQAGGVAWGATSSQTEADPDTGPVDVRGRAAPEVGFPPEGMAGPEAPPGDVAPPPGPGEAPPEPPRTEAVPPSSSGPPTSTGVPYDVPRQAPPRGEERPERRTP